MESSIKIVPNDFGIYAINNKIDHIEFVDDMIREQTKLFKKQYKKHKWRGAIR